MEYHKEILGNNSCQSEFDVWLIIHSKNEGSDFVEKIFFSDSRFDCAGKFAVPGIHLFYL